MDEDPDDIQLSEHAMKALLEFYREKDQKYNLNNDYSTELIEEDWELSQFWYDETTSNILAQVALKAAGESGRIACISCPSAFVYIKKTYPESDRYYLFEYDKRFQEKFPDNFILYDYNHPLKISEKFKSYFDIILVDPPYLSDECLEKTAQTVKFMAKDKIILCTGAVMEESAKRLLGVHESNFAPKHKRKLGNEFKCYVNWNIDEFIKEINVCCL